ncbi:MAG: hypothetical protein IMW97_08055 [Firmicutes bacterium]|nr:hypothetical protein [Candidatus Fermentithermobacillaceae bacterium]
MVKRVQGCICEGHRWVVHIDLEKVFYAVNHDTLMSSVGRKQQNKGPLRLVR